MAPGPRDYKPSVVKRLFMLSGARCANPICSNSLLGIDDVTIISQIVHIEAASPDGPRYNSQMIDDQRRAFDNLLLLCLPCHAIVDNPENTQKYTVPVLRQWKEHRERSQKAERLRNSNLLRIAINAIADADVDPDAMKQDLIKAVNPEEKILYNSVKRNKSLIDEYKVCYSKVNSIYAELEKQGSFKKEKLLRNINAIYLKVMGKYVVDSPNKMEIIREKADDIFDEVQEELLEFIPENAENSYFEVLLIMVDAFIRCKILEEPKK